jgi:hypothetical protein
MKNLQFPIQKNKIRTISIPVPHINGTENLGLLSSFCLAQKKKVMDLVLKIRPGPGLVLTNGDQNWQLTAHD